MLGVNTFRPPLASMLILSFACAMSAHAWPVPPGVPDQSHVEPISDDPPASASAPAPTPPPPPPLSAATERAVPALGFPHPLMVEVLYAVPTGAAGDANKDGERDATGDEFVALVNPHDKPIQLLGYTITDAGTTEKAKVQFTFPPCELAPDEVVVVFNGHGASWTGPVGDEKAAPEKGDENFHNARIFTMAITSKMAAFGNQGDEIVLIAPDGQKMQRLRWGSAAEGGGAGKKQSEKNSTEKNSTEKTPGDKPKPPPLGKPEAPVVLDEVVPEVSRASVVRTSAEKTGKWRSHSEVDRQAFDPGRWPVERSGGKRDEEPEGKQRRK